MAESYEPLYTAAEMRAAEERYPGYPATIPELMERAGAAVAREAMLAYPAARSFACVCGGGSNGGDGRVAARVLREAGHVADETDDGLDGYDVVIDALFGTGFQRCAPAGGRRRHRAHQRGARRRSWRSISRPGSMPPRARSQERSSTPISR